MNYENKVKENLKNEFYKAWESEYQGEYELVDAYKDEQTSIHLKHIKCGTVRNNLPLTIRDHRGKCLKCLRKENKKQIPKLRTTEIFKEEIKAIYGYIYTLKSGETYKGLKEPITLVHVCGNEVTAEAQNFLNFYKKCICEHKVKAKTTEQYKKELKLLSKGEIELVGEYTKAKENVTLRHIGCDKKRINSDTFQAKPSSFLMNPKCPCCFKDYKCSYYPKQSTVRKSRKNKSSEVVKPEYSKVYMPLKKESDFKPKNENKNLHKKLDRHLFNYNANLNLISEVRGIKDTIILFDKENNKMIKTTPYNILNTYY